METKNQNNEEWKPIKGYEGLYEISNFGRVKSLNYNKTHRKQIMKPVKDKENYLTIVLSNNGKIKGYKISRLVYEAFIGPIPKDYQVNHIDEDKTNNCVWNLNLMTAKENANWGTRNEKCKIKLINHISTSKQVRCIETNTIYPSTNEAKRQLGLCKHLNFKRSIDNNWKIGGYHWEYVA